MSFLNVIPCPAGRAIIIGSIGVAEIEDIALVRQIHVPALEFMKHPSDRGCTAGSGKPGDENIVPVVFHFQADLKSPERPVLSDNLF